MAYKKKSDINLLPMETEIELIAIKGDEVFKKVMKYGDALNIPRKKGWHYYYFQLGFSQFNLKNK